MQKTPFVPGLTFPSVLASIFALLLTGIFTQYFDILIGLSFASEHTLALPAFWTFLLIFFLGALIFAGSRMRILSRAELLVVMFVMLISAPLMTQGFWHRLVAIIATNPRMGDFEKMDAFNDKLWPHGPNLIADCFGEKNRDRLVFQGNQSWEDIEYELGKTASLPVFVNKEKDAVSGLRITLPLEPDGKPFVVRGEPYIVSILIRAQDLGPATKFFCRAYNDGGTAFTDFFTTAQPPKISFLHKKGFVRVGAYGVKFSTEARQKVTLEFGLAGNGRVECGDPKLFSVAALEGIYKGKMIVTQSTYDRLPPEQRANLIVKPDNMLSWRGLLFVLSGYIPVRDWLGPIATWTSFVVLLLLATLAVNVIMRRQWLDNERFLMPVARIPAALMDNEGEEDKAVPAIWKNRLMWLGFAITLVWVLLKAWNFYNPRVPYVAVKIPLQPYFSDPGWGGMWNIRFEIVGIFLAMCIFMELNVLISLVVGYLLYRSQFWIGDVSGMNVNPNYPWPYVQAIGAYLGYAAMVIFFTRKYLWRVFRAAVTGDKTASADEAMSYRAAFLLLLATVIGSGIWAWWLGIAASSMVIFFVFLVTIGFVAAKIRTECGAPWGYFAPMNLALLMVLLGGISRFGAEATLFFYVTSFMLAPTVFFLIPGAQMELLELGRRWKVTPRHLWMAAILGIVGGMVVGGWIFLSNAYALGGETSRYAWAFGTKESYFFSYNQDMAAATNQFLGQAKGAVDTGIDPAWWAFGISAAVTMILTVLRQIFAGFWFHPIGFVLGSANLMDYIWGSALTAWVIRGTVLWMGGAATVRNKLQPFFIGVFVAEALAYLILGAHAAYLHSIGIEKIYPILTP